MPRKNILIILLVAVSFFALAASDNAGEKAVNLKVLPKDITEHALDDIMVKECGEALGVKCNYCHVQDKATEKFDYASDAIPEKDTARSMMRMTLELNKKFFGKSDPMIGDKTSAVTCYTCHRGNAVPKDNN
ncbi:c-type cytochrome [Sediminibacterium roseum]|uniref:Photosynthetic reaction center cytochrome c subunit n=1 Tax=Sediminibacterium roseum TaxID=1978412 RepID=A0ABW9ZPI4_9BACT|nr:c-type cytochrome [Sediminibacterium roseum]NCI49007.1 c-type cytochrome [Sediminibacterium roseum]